MEKKTIYLRLNKVNKGINVVSKTYTLSNYKTHNITSNFLIRVLYCEFVIDRLVNIDSKFDSTQINCFKASIYDTKGQSHMPLNVETFQCSKNC